LKESLMVMTDLQRIGEIRMSRASATPAERIVEAEQRQFAPVRSEQCIYSILGQKVEEGVLPICQCGGIGVKELCSFSKYPYWGERI
jgi:aryl-alcohol dehydrogenase-like predicted oxidoreductase